MTVSEIQIAPDQISQARRRYEESFIPLDNIDELITQSPALARHIMRQPAGHEQMTEGDETESPVDEGQTAYKAAPEMPMALSTRLHESIERGLAAIDHVLDNIDPASESVVECSARTLALIARTLREIAAMTQLQEMTQGMTIDDEADDDPLPRDIDEFRRVLTRRVQKFIDAERDGAGEDSVGETAHAPRR